MAAHRRTASNDHVRIEVDDNQSDQDPHGGPSDDTDEIDLNEDEPEEYLNQLLPVPNGSYNGIATLPHSNSVV